MRAFRHPDQARHDPQQSMRFGKVIAAKDKPARAEKPPAALKARDVAVGCRLDAFLGGPGGR